MPQPISLIHVTPSPSSGIELAMPKARPVAFLYCHPRRDPAMKVKPLGDRIVVRRQEAEEKTAGGILLPDSAKDKPQKGKVLAVGAGKLLKDGTRKGVQVK